MLILISKIFAIVLALLVLARSITDYRTRKESLSMTAVWVIIWLAIVVAAVNPNLIQLTLKTLGGDRTGLGTLFSMAIVFLLFITYRVYVKTHRIEKQINDLIKNSALEKISKDKKPGSRSKKTK